MSEKEKEKTTAVKVMKHMLKNERSLTERKKQNQWRGGRAIKHILRGKRGRMDGVG